MNYYIKANMQPERWLVIHDVSAEVRALFFQRLHNLPGKPTGQTVAQTFWAQEVLLQCLEQAQGEAIVS